MQNMSENLFKAFVGGPEEFERVRRLFTCSACRRDVMRGGKFIPEAQDSMTFCGCQRLTVGFWEFESAIPDAKRWRKLRRFAKQRKAEVIMLGPSAGGRRDGLS
jgi:hypothetical protein